MTDITDLQHIIDDSRSAISLMLRDKVNTLRAQQQAPAVIDPDDIFTVGNGRGGLAGTLATGGTSNNRGSAQPNYQPYLNDVPARLEAMPQRSGPEIIGQRITERAQWILRVPWGTDVKGGDLVDYIPATSSEDLTPRRFKIKDLLPRTDQLTFSFIVEGMQ